MIISKIQKRIALKAIRNGICENFGQEEIRKLKEKHGYEWYGTENERKTAEEIDFLDNWCMKFDDNMLEKWKVLLGLKAERF